MYALFGAPMRARKDGRRPEGAFPPEKGIGPAMKPWHLIVLLIIVLAIWGPSNLPKLGAMVGKMFREIKDLKDEIPSKEDLTKTAEPATKKRPPTKPA